MLSSSSSRSSQGNISSRGFDTRRPDHAPTRTKPAVPSTCGPDRGRKVVAHASRTGVYDHLLATLESKRLERGHAGGSIGQHDDIVPVQVVRQRIDKYIRVDRC